MGIKEWDWAHFLKGTWGYNFRLKQFDLGSIISEILIIEKSIK